MRELDVFGRRVLVERTDDRWRAFYPGTDGKRRTARDLPIPDFVRTDDELVRYLADLCHEGATPERGDVRWIT